MGPPPDGLAARAVAPTPINATVAAPAAISFPCLICDLQVGTAMIICVRRIQQHPAAVDEPTISSGPAWATIARFNPIWGLCGHPAPTAARLAAWICRCGALVRDGGSAA